MRRRPPEHSHRFAVQFNGTLAAGWVANGGMTGARLVRRDAGAENGSMIAILRCNDPVLLSVVETLLKGAGIGVFVADQHMSALEGSIGAFQRRVMVDRDDEHAARRLMIEAGLGHELLPEGQGG
jgi:hypothetical protein